jgi:hypothetical protein
MEGGKEQINVLNETREGSETTWFPAQPDHLFDCIESGPSGIAQIHQTTIGTVEHRQNDK